MVHMRIIQGSIIGVIKGDTRSSDCSSCGFLANWDLPLYPLRDTDPHSEGGLDLRTPCGYFFAMWSHVANSGSHYFQCYTA